MRRLERDFKYSSVGFALGQWLVPWIVLHDKIIWALGIREVEAAIPQARGIKMGGYVFLRGLTA